MTLTKFFKFLFWFAWHDLFEKQARSTSIVILSTVAIVTAFALVVFGLAFGYEASRLNQIRRDPLALCLWVGSPVVRDEITPQKLSEIRVQLPQALSTPDGCRGVFGLHEIELEWIADPTKPDNATPLPGRTIAEGDPLLESCVLQSGDVPFGPQATKRGVVISQRMISSLGWKDAPTGPLSLRTPSKAIISVPLLGVTQENLPLGHNFVITESYEIEIGSTAQNRSSVSIDSGPIPKGWEDLFSFPGPVLDALRTLLIEELNLYGTPAPRDVAGTWVWKFKTNNGEERTRSQWTEAIKKIRDKLNELGYAAPEEFLRITEPDPDPVEFVDPRADYDLAAVYLTDVKHLDPSIAAIKKMHLKVDEDVAKQVRAVGKTTSIIVIVLLAISLVVLIVAGWNMYTILALRAQQKIAEIGMMKAIGVTGRLLAWIFVVEGVLLWLGGAITGSLVGIFGTKLVLSLVRSQVNQAAQMEFECPIWMILSVVFILGTICLATSLLATHQARRASASECLSVG